MVVLNANLMKDVKSYLENAAKKVQLATICSVHGKVALYETSRSGDKISINWTFCCDNQKEIVQGRFDVEMKKSMDDYIKESLKNAFTGS